MIRNLQHKVEAYMRAKGFVATFEYGPLTRDRNTAIEDAIVFERNRESGDGFDGPAGFARNPRKVMTRFVGARATVFAQSTQPGADVFDHEAKADLLVDALQCALYAETKTNSLEIRSGRFLTRREIDEMSESFEGVAYRLDFQVGRGVLDRDWQGEGVDVGEIQAVANTATVTGSSPG